MYNVRSIFKENWADFYRSRRQLFWKRKVKAWILVSKIVGIVSCCFRCCWRKRHEEKWKMFCELELAGSGNFRKVNKASVLFVVKCWTKQLGCIKIRYTCSMCRLIFVCWLFYLCLMFLFFNYDSHSWSSGQSITFRLLDLLSLSIFSSQLMQMLPLANLFLSNCAYMSERVSSGFLPQFITVSKLIVHHQWKFPVGQVFVLPK